MIRCDVCGEYNGDTRETCFQCGESLHNPQGIERRVMCDGCGNVYTTARRYCPQCGGLLREFSGSTEMARLIRAQRELDATELPCWEKVLCYLIPGFGIGMSRYAYFQGDVKKAEQLWTHGWIGSVLQLVILVLMLIVLIIADASLPGHRFDPNQLPEVTVTSGSGYGVEEDIP